MGPHSPYDPPTAYRGTFGDDVEGETVEDLWEAIRTHPERLTDEQIQTVVDLYDEEIRRFDDNLKRLFEAIDLEETVVAIVADHGELFGEHENHFQHGPWMYDELLHVPMLFLGPGVPESRVEIPVSLIDLVPTLLSASGDEDVAPAGLRGRDLLTDPSPAPVLACSAHEGTQVTDLDWSRRRLMVRTDQWKLLRQGTESGVEEHWYDLQSGRGVAADESCPEHLRDTMDEFESNLGVGSGARAQEPSDELTDRLEDLGYLQ